MLAWKSSLPIFYRTMYMNKNSPLTPFIAHELKKLAEVGIQNVLSKRHIIPEPNCEPIHTSSYKNLGLGMETFASIFAFYLIGFVVSLIILVLENIFKPSKPNTPQAEKLRLEALQKELKIFAKHNGLRILGDLKFGGIILKK